MNARTTEYLIKNKGAEFDLGCEKSAEGIVVPTPVIFESEILGENRPVLYWCGDDEGGKQREFPLCVSPEFFDKELAADPKNCDIWRVGLFADLQRSQYRTSGHNIMCHRKYLEEETPLVCGMISGMTFIFEIVSIGVECRLIRPMLYIKKERMSPGGVELDF